MTHSPPPWKIDVVRTSTSWCVAVTDASGALVHFEESGGLLDCDQAIANAKLITAAPLFLDVWRRFIEGKILYQEARGLLAPVLVALEE